MSSVHKFVTVTKELAGYINRLLEGAENSRMNEVREETENFEHGEMQTPLSQLRVMASIMQMIDARRVLEIGTFRGMGAARLAQAFSKDIVGAKVITLERDLRYVDELKKRWTDLGLLDRIELRSGPALTLLDALANEVALDGYFDLAFIDADKENYKVYVEKTLRLLRPKGVLLVDNTLWGGDVVNADSDSNITGYIRNFNTWVFEKFGTNASVIPAWDGLTIIVKE